MSNILNEKFGITMDCEVNVNSGIIGKVHIFTANEVEIDAFVMEDVEEYQDQIKEEIEVIKNLKTEYDVVKFIEGYSSYELAKSVDEYDYVLDFKHFTIRVINN